MQTAGVTIITGSESYILAAINVKAFIRIYPASNELIIDIKDLILVGTAMTLVEQDIVAITGITVRQINAHF